MAWITTASGDKGTQFCIALPDSNNIDPIQSQKVDYINRPSGRSCGSGDVFISHMEYSPVDEDIHIDPSVYSKLVVGYNRITFCSYSSDTPVNDQCYWSPIGNGYTRISSRSATQWEASFGLYKYRDEYRGRSRYWQILGNVYYYTSREEAESALSHAVATARTLLALCRTDPYYCPSMPSSKFRMNASYRASYSSDIVIDVPPLELYNSRLDSYIESRQVYTPSIRDSGVDSGLFYRAYYSAIEKLPALQQNLMANIVDCVSTIASFANGFDSSDLRNIKKVTKDLWLRYRYQYSTTVSDAKEMVSAIERLQDIAGKDLSTYGTASSGNYSVSVALSLRLDLPTDINGWLKSLNLRPTLVNVWDMVPYSFVVDWFLKIGSLLEDLQRWLDAADLQPQSLWYSVWHRVDEPGTRGLEYCRFSGSPPSLPYFTSGQVGARTIGMRAADTVSLFLM